jgi:hypothetical protein
MIVVAVMPLAFIGFVAWTHVTEWLDNRRYRRNK